MTSNENLVSTLGVSLVSKITSVRLLIVGAGGIGCELIKNLVLSGFTNLVIIDLDTIDVSNLNRQFLFRSEHVGKSKAKISKEIALTFNPKVNIVAHHANIKEKQFNMDFFSTFDLVLNALDNVDARRHVNRLCLATKIPLIESGTTGYLGQVSVIAKDESECYECTAKVTQKVYPICTIRSTPDKPVHCIVWGKECFKLLFGKIEDSMLWEDTVTCDEVSSFMHLVERPDYNAFENGKKGVEEYVHGVFSGLFEHEILKKLSMDLYKGASSTPAPIVLSKLQVTMETTFETNDTGVLQDRKVWSVAECAVRFMKCIAVMYEKEENRELLGNIVFDKDDAWAMEFVTAAANLRSSIFHIDLKSLYDCKGIAGNIIPAIATTNAIIAGLQIAEAFKIVAGVSIPKACKYTYCNRSWDSRGVLISPIDLSPPNKECYVCSTTVLHAQLDTATMTLQTFVDQVLKKRLGVNEPTISIGANTIYEEGDDAEESLCIHLPKILCDLPGGGMHHGVTVSIEDFSQDFELCLCINTLAVNEFDEESCPLKFRIGEEITRAQAEKEKAEKEANGESMQEDEEDKMIIEESLEIKQGKKQEASSSLSIEEERAVKRQKRS